MMNTNSEIVEQLETQLDESERQLDLLKKQLRQLKAEQDDGRDQKAEMQKLNVDNFVTQMNSMFAKKQPGGNDTMHASAAAMPTTQIQQNFNFINVEAASENKKEIEKLNGKVTEL